MYGSPGGYGASREFGTAHPKKVLAELKKVAGNKMLPKTVRAAAAALEETYKVKAAKDKAKSGLALGYGGFELPAPVKKYMLPAAILGGIILLLNHAETRSIFGKRR
jgi:hypothetical protein